MEKNDWEDLSTKETQTKDEKNLLPRFKSETKAWKHFHKSNES